MANYLYKVKDLKGNVIKGTYEAQNASEVIAILRDRKYFVLEVKEKLEQKEIKLGFNPRVKSKDLAIFSRQFSTLIGAGIPVLGGLDILRKQTQNKRLKSALDEIYEEVQKGRTLSQTFGSHPSIFPEMFINMIEAGEVSGTLDNVLDRMAKHFEKENKINQKIKSATTYPKFLAVLCIGVVIFLLTSILPTFVGMFEGAGVDLPTPTRILLGISDGIKNFWYIIIGVITVVVIGFKKYSSSPQGRLELDKLYLRLPYVSVILNKIITVRFTRTLGTLSKSGIPIIRSMEIVEKIVGNRLVALGFEKARDDIRRGQSVAKSIEKIGIFSPLVVQMMAIGEETGTLDSILEKTSEFFDDEVETAMTQMASLFEPVMLLVMAVVVGFIIIAMMMPMFEMVNTLDF
jgi:type IV pilus assembly protein PilC